MLKYFLLCVGGKIILDTECFSCVDAALCSKVFEDEDIIDDEDDTNIFVEAVC